MAIAFDAATDGGANLTWSHTCTGDNRILFVAVMTDVAGDGVNGITYDSVALTKINSVQGGNTRYISLWYLINPATGSNTVSLDVDDFHLAGSISYTGALQSGVPDAQNTGTETAQTSQTLGVTTVLDNCWMIMIACTNGAAVSAGTGATERVDAGVNYNVILDSNGALTPAGAHSLQATAISTNWGSLVASFAPVAAPPPEGLPGYKSLLGVGR